MIDPKALWHSLPLFGVLLLLILVGKLFIWSIVVRLFRYPFSTAITVAAGLTQIGEMSFVLVQVARSSGLVAEDVFSATIAASLTSILINVFLVRAVMARLDREASVAASQAD